MLPVPRPERPPKPPDAKKLYAESDALKLPPPPVTPKPLEQKEVTYALAKRYRKAGYPRVLGPLGVDRVPLYFCDRAKDIAEALKTHKRRYGKTKHYYDSCTFYDNNDPHTFRLQGIYHSYYNEYWQTLAKVDECIKLDPRNFKALLLKADTLFRMCNFESALLIYSQGINLKFPYKNWFVDGYYRTTALLYNLASGDLPMFYGGNMKVFYRLVRGQERELKMFNDTYKHYDEIFPLEPNFSGEQEEINMFHVYKAGPPEHVERKIKIAAIKQLHCAKRILGGFWEHKIEVERHLIQKHYHLPRFGRQNQSEKIEKALSYLKGRMDQFEVLCAFLRNHALRQYDRQKDWMIEYGKWMKQSKHKSTVPPAKTGGMENSRYRWALSQTLFEIRNKPLDVCWIRRLNRYRKSDRYKKHGHIFGQRHQWRHFIAQKSAKSGALAALRNKGNDWSFMRKLNNGVWTTLEKHAPMKEEVKVPAHIREVQERIASYLAEKDAQANTELLTMPSRDPPKYKDRLYYDPDTNVEQYEENRRMLKEAILKRDEKPAIIPTTPDRRPIPARLLEVFETKVHEESDSWDNRRRMSTELREGLAKAEAVKAAHAAEKRVMFSSNAKKEPTKLKDKDHSDVDVSESHENASVAGSGSTSDPKKAEQTPSLLAKQDLLEEAPLQEIHRKVAQARKPGERFKYDILKKKPDIDTLSAPRVRRRLDRSKLKEEPVVEAPVVQERVKTAEELEAERLLAARNDDPFEIAKRKFDNQKAALLEKAFAVLMTCSRISEFMELELEIADLLDETFPPESMRFPNGEPIELAGYPPPSDNFKALTLETLGSTIKKRKKKNDGGKNKPITGAEAEKEAAAVKALTEEKGRRASLKPAAKGPAQKLPVKPAAAPVTAPPVEAPPPPLDPIAEAELKALLNPQPVAEAVIAEPPPVEAPPAEAPPPPAADAPNPVEVAMAANIDPTAVPAAEPPPIVPTEETLPAAPAEEPPKE